MGLLNKLNTEGSNLSKLDGITPTPSPTSTKESPLHNTYSLDGIPDVAGSPQPSQLDLDGVTPPKYIDNLPQ